MNNETPKFPLTHREAEKWFSKSHWIIISNVMCLVSASSALLAGLKKQFDHHTFCLRMFVLFVFFFKESRRDRERESVEEEVLVQLIVKVLCSTTTNHLGFITSSTDRPTVQTDMPRETANSPNLECKKSCKWTALKADSFLGGLNTRRASLHPSRSHTLVWYHRAQWVSSSVISTSCLWQLGRISRRCVMWSHAAPWCVGLTRVGNKGLGLDSRERRLGGRRRGASSHAAEVVCVNN